jgi:hypothetical protein
LKQRRPNNAHGLPYGTGALFFRGSFWMIYRDEHGVVAQENTHSKDKAEAVRLLATRAIPAARARLAALERLASAPAPKEWPPK